MLIKNFDKINYSLSGQLDKQSKSLFIGFQTKFFSLLENGTKIAYRNINETQFKEQNTFLVRDCVVCQFEEKFSFTLETPKRTYILKAKDEITKVTWMRTITQIRKQIIRKKFKFNMTSKLIEKPKIIPSSTQNTLPNFSTTSLNQAQHSLEIQNQRKTQRIGRMAQKQISNPQKEELIKKDFSELLKNIPDYFVKYNILIATLKTKVQNLFTATFYEATYILFSSKCLYPSLVEEISEQNLTSMMLPPWAEVNKMYKYASNHQNPKLILQVSKIIDIQEPKQQKTCIKIRTQETVHYFYCQTIEQKDRLKLKFQLAVDNYKEAFINGKLTRRNHDNLVRLYFENFQLFSQKVKQIIGRFILNNHHYEPHVVIKFVDAVIPWIQQLVQILKYKKQNCHEILHYILNDLHSEVKIHIKLTWDSSYTVMKGEDILKFLNALAAYHSIIKIHLNDFQFLNGMKQLSKIYVRSAWNNFEDIILGIVEQQKKINLLSKDQSDDDHEYLETNAIIDLFKFIYQVFDLAAPCWEHKLHLHNVQRLMCRAIEVFIIELKATADDTVLANRQLIGIANNYFRFCITVDEFYNDKFSQLQQKTKQNYEKLKTDYKQLSNIILDKIAYDMRFMIRKFFDKATFYKIDAQKLCQILKQSTENIQIHLLHPIFIKRFYEKLFTTVRQGILSLLQKEVSSKKKHKVAKILQTLESISSDMLDISKLLYNGKNKIQQQLKEVNTLLSCQNQNEILKLIKSSGEDIRKVYLNIINLRQDYYTGSTLYYILNEQNAEKSSVSLSLYNNQTKNSIKPPRITISKEKQMRVSLSSYYINHEFESHSSVDKSDHDFDEPLKLISEGYLMKCKTNKRIWETVYFRLKNGTLYFFQSDKSEKCQNSISVSDMLRVQPGGSKQSLGFVIQYLSLNREKRVELKSETIEIRDRWLESINLELKRVNNDDKVKKQKLKLKQNKKNHLIIDYEQLMNGKGYFSYTNVS